MLQLLLKAKQTWKQTENISKRWVSELVSQRQPSNQTQALRCRNSYHCLQSSSTRPFDNSNSQSSASINKALTKKVIALEKNALYYTDTCSYCRSQPPMHTHNFHRGRAIQYRIRALWLPNPLRSSLTEYSVAKLDHWKMINFWMSKNNSQL